MSAPRFLIHSKILKQDRRTRVLLSLARGRWSVSCCLPGRRREDFSLLSSSARYVTFPSARLPVPPSLSEREEKWGPQALHRKEFTHRPLSFLEGGRRSCTMDRCGETPHASTPVWYFGERVHIRCTKLFTTSNCAVSRQFSLQPSCHLAVVPISSFSNLSLLPLSPARPRESSAEGALFDRAQNHCERFRR